MEAVSDKITGPYISNERNLFLAPDIFHTTTGCTVQGINLVELEDGRWYVVMLGIRGM